MAYVLAMNPRNRVRLMRKKAGLSQADLAQRTGISQPAVSQIENDVRPLTVDWMRTIARVLGCAPSELLGDDDNPDRLSDDERALIQAYRAAQPSQRTLIERIAAPVDEGERRERAA